MQTLWKPNASAKTALSVISLIHKDRLSCELMRNLHSACAAASWVQYAKWLLPLDPRFEERLYKALLALRDREPFIWLGFRR